MKNYHYSLLSLFVLFLITSAKVKTNQSKHLFEKTIFVEISFNEDSVLFKPFSRVWDEDWKTLTTDISINGSSLMNSGEYKRSFNAHSENLWTVLHPMIINGSIQTYCPYNTESYGLGLWDDGELKYPLIDQEKNETFLTSEKVQGNLCYLLGRFGPQSDVPLVNQFGNDSVIVLPDSTTSYVYRAPRYYWYEDRHIVKYKLRVSILLNKNGKEKKRIIQSISPIVNLESKTGVITGERELIWLKFEELEPFLKKAYYFDEDWKSISYLNYFLEKVKDAPLQMKG